MSETIQTAAVSEAPVTPPDPRGAWTHASEALPDSLCPGRFLAQQGQPDTSGADARTGDRIHKALAWDPRSTDPAVIPDNPVHLSADDRDMFESCRELEKKLQRQYFLEDAPASGDARFRAFREQRHWVRFVGPDGKTYEHSGQADVIFRSGPKALVIDYKTGRLDVEESPRNLQLRDLACLARGHLVGVTEIATAIIQPFVSREPTICVYDLPALDRATREMFDRIVASHVPGAVRVAGEEQCKYCRAKRVCVEYQKFAGTLTPPAMLTVLEVPMVNWTPEQRAVALNALGPAQKFLDDIKDFAKDLLTQDPGAIPGWGLKPGSVRQSINDPTRCYERFLAIGGKPEAFMLAVTIAKSKLKDAVAKATGAKGGALTKAIEALTDGIVDEKQTEPSLKRLEDQ